MIRKIIHINEEKCDGCGLCANACHEGAIAMIDGKARLIRDDYCDGLGDCLPACPQNAITFIEREAAPYDEKAVKAHLAAKEKNTRQISSALSNWPVQIRLVSPQASCFQNADLLIAADCAAFAYGAFHRDFICGKVTLVGCPKLDPVHYEEKLTEIFTINTIRSVTLARMEVPCCGGLEYSIRKALSACGKDIPLQISVISLDGNLLS